MESIIARALEYTLKYWLKSFSRDQFKLQGRTVQLSNLDINGDALHASIGLPPAIHVATAKVGKLEIILPSLSYVQVEPIVVQIDRLDLVLVENDDVDASKSASSQKSNTAKSNGYGFADKIADGMTLEVRTVNLLLETHGGMRHKGGASWASPMASITIRNLLLYTTNENWQVVNLKEARDFSNDKKFIYVFKKLEWQSLSIDLLPHPDMFNDANFDGSAKGSSKKDEDGAKRVFFGGERFIEGISGEAHITIQRTDLNSPLGLEVQLHIAEAVCPSISEPGLRALLRFLTGLYVCLNRGDVNPYNEQSSSEAAGRSLVSIIVDHIFLCIKDTDFQLQLQMQSLLFSRTSMSDGEKAKHLTCIMISGLILRDTFSRPPCTLVQPMMYTASEDVLAVPEFADNFCPPIYPLGDQDWKPKCGVPLFCLHSLQLKPSPAPPILASQSVIECQPLMIHLQEESCLRIASFLADGIVVNPGAVLPEYSINTLTFNLKGLDATVPLELGIPTSRDIGAKATLKNSFVEARLLVEHLFFCESPVLSLGLLNLEKDPACFSFWEGQPIDSSQKKMKAGAALVSISLETSQGSTQIPSSPLLSGLGRCVDLKDFCLEVALATATGAPLKEVPPPGGVVRIGVAFQQFLSNTSVEQLFLILDLYAYFGKVGEKISVIGNNNPLKEYRDEGSNGSLMDKVPGDTAVSLAVKNIKLRFLESSSEDDIQGVPLVQFVGDDLFTKVTHRTLGGAMAISSNLRWESIEVDCAETFSNSPEYNGPGNGHSQLRSVLWVQNKGIYSSSDNSTSSPFLEINVDHVIPYNPQDMACHSLSVSACITGLRLGGGMNYSEALLHRFGILGPDGGPGEGLTKGLEHLSAGPLSKLLKASPTVMDKIPQDEENNSDLKLGTPDDLDVSIELKDWLFALEGEQEAVQNWWFGKPEDAEREERSWHTTFRSVCVKTKGGPNNLQYGEVKSVRSKKYPVDLITVGVAGLQILKPLSGKSFTPDGMLKNGSTRRVESYGGVNFGVDIVTSEDDLDDGMPKWIVENMKFSVKEPIEAVVTKDELEYLTVLCKSEVDSLGRITAGVLRLLKLESSIGPQALGQLSNLGSEGFDKIFSPQTLGRGSSVSSIGISPASSAIESSRNSGLEYTVASLEEVMLEAQAKCAALSAELGTSTTSQGHLDDHVKDLRQRLASMQKLLQHLRSQI